jgi:hypothetical protein
MLEKLRNVISGRRGHQSGENPPPTCNQAGGSQGDSSESPVVLLSRRFADPVENISGFQEAYYCTKCRDYFVLAWHFKSSPLVGQCDVVQDMRPSLQGVFCPRCQSDYAMYGPIQNAGAPLDQWEDVRVYETLDYPFPRNVPSTPAGRIKIGSLSVENIVMLVTGEFPDGMDVRDFAYSGFTAVVLSRHGGDVLVSEESGIRLHVLRVSTIVDETSWLTPLLKREVYRTQNWGTKVFLTYGVIALKPPLERALFCLVLSDGPSG